MSWTSLDEDDATSSSEAEEEFIGPDIPVEQIITRLKENDKKTEGDSQYSGLGSQIEESNSVSCNPFVQEPNSDNEMNSNKESPSHQELKNLLTIKDDRIHTLQKLINGQREQLYHFLNMSLKEETLLELKKTCQETEALNRNDNICMALDKFKFDNNIPTEQTLVREDVSRTLLKIERLMRHQTKLVKSMESGENNEKLYEDVGNSIEISCYQLRDDQLTDIQKLLKSTKQIQRNIQILKIHLKKLSLIEQERIDLIERVYSMPPDQRQYYAHLAVIEREKIQLRLDIDQLSNNYKDLKQKCCFLEETEQELNKCIDGKIADLDLNKIKPGLETHLELMDMVERGELSLITMTKDEKGNFTGDFMKLYNENAEISERLKDFDRMTRERDHLKRQIEVLVENCLRLQSEVKALRLASKTDDLLEQLRLACLEREQLRTKLEGMTKESSNSIFNIWNKTAGKISGEKEQIEPKLAETEDVETVFDKSDKSPDMVRPLDINRLRNIPKQLERMNELEKQRKQLSLDISRYRHALLKQEEEIKDLVLIVDKLMKEIKILRINDREVVNPYIEGIPEGSEIISPKTAVLKFEEEKRVEMIRSRIFIREEDNSKSKISRDESKIQSNCRNLEKNKFITSVKSFLGFENSLQDKRFDDR